MQAIAVLFARRDSVYKKLPGCDVWDADRDARRWPGGAPVVAHPPCRAWGGFAYRARPEPGEYELAPWAVEQVRRWGGVLEHPARSRLWPAAGLPEPGERDRWGGWTLPIHQFWWGHRAEKATRLYIVGVEPRQVPIMPLALGRALYVVGDSGRAGFGKRPEIAKREREATPPALAEWLVELARRSHRSHGGVDRAAVGEGGTGRAGGCDPARPVPEGPPSSSNAVPARSAQSPTKRARRWT